MTAATTRTRNKGASGEAERRLTIAERRRAEQQEALAGRTGSTVVDRTGSSQKETHE